MGIIRPDGLDSYGQIRLAPGAIGILIYTYGELLGAPGVRMEAVTADDRQGIRLGIARILNPGVFNIGRVRSTGAERSLVAVKVSMQFGWLKPGGLVQFGDDFLNA